MFKRVSILVAVVLISLAIAGLALASARSASLAPQQGEVPTPPVQPTGSRLLPEDPPPQASLSSSKAQAPGLPEAYPPLKTRPDTPSILPQPASETPPFQLHSEVSKDSSFELFRNQHSIDIIPGDWDGRINQPDVFYNGSDYLMWYVGWNSIDPNARWSLGLAESGDGLEWAKNPANPVITPADPPAWDDFYRGQTDVLYEGGQYKMWYSGASDGPWQVGYATSFDGISWSYYSGNPVLPNGGPGEWDEGEADAPTVIHDGSTYKMWYHGCNSDYSVCGIGYATSPNGTTWTKYGGNPVLTGTPGTWDENFTLWPAVEKIGSTYSLWYIGNAAGYSQVGYATSSDGINWSKLPDPVLPGSWDGSSVRGFDVLNINGTYQMWLAGGWYTDPGIGYAESPDGISWTFYNDNPVLEPGYMGVSPIVNYANDWVGATTSPGTQITVTVSDAGGVIATAVGYGKEDGWFITDETFWYPQRPDLIPGQTVLIEAPGGSTDILIGTIDGALDVDANTIAGTVNAPFTQTLSLWCEVWTNYGYASLNVMVDPNGGSYFCDFDEVGWDLQPSEDVAITYYEPDNDGVTNVFREPGPALAIAKWTPGAYARPEGVYLYGIDVYNDGDGTAENTLVVDTLPEGATYLGHTGGYPVEIGPGGIITFSLGTVEAYSDNIFWVTVALDPAIPPGPGAIAENCASVWTTSLGDNNYDNNSTCTPPVDIWDDEVEVGIDKWPNIGDPTPGQEYYYNIGVCNNRGAAAGPLIVTDTLPAYTTLVDWFVRNWWEPMWNEVSRDNGQLILSAPAFPGWFCQEIYVILAVDPDAPLNTNLVNTVEVSVADDVDLPNNIHIDTDAFVSQPRPDLSIDKWENSGVLVPGGYARLAISYKNQGNTLVQGLITDTLPAGTSYRVGSGWLWNNQGPDGWLFEPVTITDEYVVWDLGDLPIRRAKSFDYQLNIDPDYEPGIPLVSCAEIGFQGEDFNPSDNTKCIEQNVFERGPNLRVIKSHQWNNEGQLWYDLLFENIGNQPVNNVWVTDTLPALTQWDGNWSMNFDWGRLIEQDLQPHQLRWKFSTLYPGDVGNFNFQANLDEPGVPFRYFINTAEIFIPAGDPTPDDNTDIDEAFSGSDIKRVEFWNIGYPKVNMWGQALPYTTLYVETDHGTFSTSTNGNGDWNLDDVGQIDAGDTVIVTQDGGQGILTINVPNPTSVEADSSNGQVWGQVGGFANDRVEIHGWWNNGYQETYTNENGEYSVTYQNMPGGARGHLRFVQYINGTDVIFHRQFLAPDLVARVNYGHDWVEGHFPVGHVIDITLTESDGTTVKATSQLTSEYIEGWGYEPGFATWQENWLPQNPNLQPGDWVYVESDDGQNAVVQIGEIQVNIDVDQDTISGQIFAPWFTETLQARCEVWEHNAPSVSFVVNPNGGSYSCDFSALGWDLQPGQDAGVSYIEPDDDEVINITQAPVPHLRINTYSDGQLGEGGNAQFVVDYWNDEDGEAENTVISATLTNMDYLYDTSGFPYTIGILPGGETVVTWDLGIVPPYSYNMFYIFTEIAVPAGGIVTNTVNIATSNPFDQGGPWEKWSTWVGPVETNNTMMNVGKWALTGDPAPGYDFIWAVNSCNTGSTGSSKIIVTDTLPAHTTLNDWWGQHDGWEEVWLDGEKLVASRGTVPSWWCSEIYLNLHLDESVQPGDEISNTAQIYVENDTDGDWNNITTHWIQAGTPHLNINTGIDWNWGVLVPGGQIRYNINAGNNGNVPIEPTYRITETLPVSTTFVEAYRWNGQQIWPVVIGDGYLVWEFPSLMNGFNRGFEVILNLDANTPVGTALVHEVEVQQFPGEDTYDDNFDSDLQYVYDHGPNLKVEKWGGWHGDYEGHGWFNITIQNVGDQPLEHVAFTDTLPAGMDMEGDPWFPWGDIEAYDSQEGWWSAKFFNMHPNFRRDFGFNFAIPEIQRGTLYTNTLEIETRAGETYPVDNLTYATLKAGPDIYVQKTLVAGEVLPGEIITYSLLFGNDQPGHTWWWNMQGDLILTDTLPVDLEYITSTLRWCGDTQFCPLAPNSVSGNEYTWWLWPMPASNWNEIYLTVRIPAEAEDGDTFTNLAEAVSSLPEVDLDPLLANNTSELVVGIHLPVLEISKEATGNLVSGTPVTYTLTAHNAGTGDATLLSMIDWTPDNFTYVGGADEYDPMAGLALWNIAALPAGETTTRWFSGTLSCSAGDAVVNDNYRVDANGEGVSSPIGAPVSFTIITPTITAAFEASTLAPMPGEAVLFTSTSTTDGTSLAFAWDFGDGTTGAGATASHTFAEPGSYEVTLTATDGCGYTNTFEMVIEVQSLQVFLPMIIR